MVRLTTLLAAISALAVAATVVAAATASHAHVQGRYAAVPVAPRPAVVATLRPKSRLAAHPARRRSHSESHRHPHHSAKNEVLTVRPGRRVALRSRPNGAVAVQLGDRTEFGSQTTFTVAKRRGGWVGVTTTALPNGSLGWLRPSSAELSRAAVDVELVVTLSRRSIALRKSGRTIRQIPVTIGRPGSETPTGRFAVTDKLAGGTFGAYYGCCILALSGHQSHLPPGWKGGDRLAIHGTDSPGTIGRPASAGCLRAADSDLHVLVDKVPLGTPVVIRH